MTALSTLSLLIAVASLVDFPHVWTRPTKPEFSLRRRETPEVCRALATRVADAMPAGQNAGVLLDEPQQAADCLDAVGIVPADVIQTIDDLVQLVKFSANIEYVKQIGVGGESVDVIGRLEGLKDRAVPVNGFRNNYEFEFFAKLAIASARDPSLDWSGEMSMHLLQWRRPDAANLLSVSANGVEFPKLYLAAEAVDLSDAPPGTYSAISRILSYEDEEDDAYDVEFSLEIEADRFSAPDEHAAYNSMLLFVNPGLPSRNPTSAFTRPMIYPGPDTTVIFENGTRLEFDNQIFVPSNPGWRRVAHSNSDFYSTFVSRFANGYHRRAETGQPIQRRDIPMRVGNQVTFQTVTFGGQRVGLLQLGHFDSTQTSAFVSWAEGVLAQPPQKLIIDVRSYTGGDVNLPMKILLTLFPAAKQPHLLRFRSQPALEILRRQGSDLLQLPTIGRQSFPGQFVDPQTGTNFASWEDLAGPFPGPAGDSFSAPFRLRYQAPPNGGGGGGDASVPPLFQPEDIAILGDGSCGDFCWLLVEFLTQDASIGGDRIRRLVVGGAPKPGPGTITGVGKSFSDWDGGQLWLASTLASFGLGGAGISDAARATLPQQPPIRSARSSVRFADFYRPDEHGEMPDPENATPVNYIYDAAHCRFFYTAGMLADASELWEYVFAVSWGGDPGRDGGMRRDMCVSGSFTAPAA